MNYIYNTRVVNIKLIGKAVTNYKMVIDVVATKKRYTIIDGQTIILPMGHRVISFDLR